MASADVEGLAAKRAKTETAWDGTLPADDVVENVDMTMKHVISEVTHELPSALQVAAGKQNKFVLVAKLHDVQPLKIKAKLESNEVSTFKAPWKPADCTTAIDTTGMYEAVANILWLDVLESQPLPTDFRLPSEELSWSNVVDIYNRLFGPNASGLARGGVTPASTSTTCSMVRYHFLVIIPVFVLDSALLNQASFEQRLHVTGGK